MTGRGRKGTGTIYLRKDGRFEGAAYLPTPYGVSKRVSFYGRTRAEVQGKLITALAKAEQGNAVLPTRRSRIGAYLEYWLREVVQPSRRVGTYEKYEMIVRLYLRPGLGSIQLTSLTVPMLQDYLNRIQRDGVTLAMAYEIRKVLSSALTRAMKEELLLRNVARLVDLAAHEAPEIKPWSVAEAVQFLSAARTDYLYPAFMLSLLYGLRRGEVLGLRWRDIDLVAGILSIRQQIHRGRDGLIIGPTKTKMSARDLRLQPNAIEELSRHFHFQRARREQFGTLWPWTDSEEPWRNEDELVFTTSTGRPVEPRNYVRSFQRICEVRNIRRIRVHDMRHTLATLASQANVSPKDVQFTLGHTKMTTTVDTYQHGSIDSSERVSKIMEEMVSSHEDRDDTSTPSGGKGASSAGIDSWVSRQDRPSSAFSDVVITSLTAGKSRANWSSDHRLTMDAETSLWECVKGVDQALRGLRRHRLVGLLAVRFAVKVVGS
jgi:integrase